MSETLGTTRTTGTTEIIPGAFADASIPSADAPTSKPGEPLRDTPYPSGPPGSLSGSDAQVGLRPLGPSPLGPWFDGHPARNLEELAKIEGQVYEQPGTPRRIRARKHPRGGFRMETWPHDATGPIIPHDPKFDPHVKTFPDKRFAVAPPENFENIPGELKSRRQWVGYSPKKIPLLPNGEPAKSTDSSTWVAYEGAVNGLLFGNYVGIGFVFSEDDPYLGIDLDKVIDPADNDVPPWVSELIECLSTYTERSPSRRGLHLIVKGRLPDGIRGGSREVTLPSGATATLEIYDRQRYFTMTGDLWRFHGANIEIADAQPVIDELLKGSKPAEHASKNHGDHGHPGHRNLLGSTGNRLTRYGPGSFDSDALERFARGESPVPRGAGHIVLQGLALRFFSAGVNLRDIMEVLGHVLTTGERGVAPSRGRSDIPRLLDWIEKRGPNTGTANPIYIWPGSRWAGIAKDVLGRPLELMPAAIPDTHPHGRVTQHFRMGMGIGGIDGMDGLGGMEGMEGMKRCGLVPTHDSYTWGSRLATSGLPGLYDDHEGHAHHNAHPQSPIDEEVEYARTPPQFRCESPRPMTILRLGNLGNGRGIFVRCRRCGGCRAATVEDWMQRTNREIQMAGWIELLMYRSDPAREAALMKRVKRAGGRYMRVRRPGGLETMIIVYPEVKETELGHRIQEKAEALNHAREALEDIDWEIRGKKRVIASLHWGGKKEEEPIPHEWVRAPVQIQCSKDELRKRLRDLGVRPIEILVRGKDGYTEGIEWHTPEGEDPIEFLWRLAIPGYREEDEEDWREKLEACVPGAKKGGG